MSVAAKVILHCPISDQAALTQFVERCLHEGVVAIATIGDSCEAVHDMIDDLIVGDGVDPERFILTSWHERENLEEVIAFLESLESKTAAIQQVQL